MFIAHSNLSASRDRNGSDHAAEPALEQMKNEQRSFVISESAAAAPCLMKLWEARACPLTPERRLAVSSEDVTSPLRPAAPTFNPIFKGDKRTRVLPKIDSRYNHPAFSRSIGS